MISFIYPLTEDRKTHFEITKKSLSEQTDRDFEVIVVDSVGTNPSKAQNEGVLRAKGEIIVLTSPEVVQAKHNVKEMAKLPLNTFWIGWVVENEIGDKEFISSDFKTLKPKRGFSVKCDEKTWADWKYFIGVIHKKDYVGMDEEFMKGIAYEDRDFALRTKLAGIKAEFNGKIAGIHLPHSRKYQDDHPELRAINRDYFFAKRARLLGL
jgi:hypothetical protein